MGTKRQVAAVALVVATLLTWGGVAGAAGAPRRGDGPPGVGFGWPGPRGAQSGALFTPLTPVRVLDTRIGTGTGGSTAPVGGGGVLTVALAPHGVPAGTEAVVLNVTGTQVTANTFVAVFPAGAERPLVSNLNLAPGQTRPNLVTVATSPDRAVSLFNSAGSTHLIADLAGYYAPAAGAGHVARSPQRVLDTRTGTGTGGSTSPVPGAGTIILSLAGLVPAGATAVTVNLTGTEGTASTFVTAYPTGAPRPVASNLNLAPGQTAPNLVTVRLGTNQRVTLYNNAGSTHLIADLAGYYAPNTGHPFHVLFPERFFDTRFDVPEGLTPDVIFELAISDLPAGTSAIMANLTGTEPTAPTFVVAWPGNTEPPPTSNLNLETGQTAPNLAVIAFGFDQAGDGLLWFRNNSGRVHLIFDAAGIFAPAFS